MFPVHVVTRYNKSGIFSEHRKSLRSLKTFYFSGDWELMRLMGIVVMFQCDILCYSYFPHETIPGYHMNDKPVIYEKKMKAYLMNLFSLIT